MGYNEFTGTNDFPEMSDLPWGPNLLSIGGASAIVRNQARQQWLAAVEDWRHKHNIPNDVWQAWNDANAQKLLSELEVKTFWQKAKAAVQSVANTVQTAVQKAQTEIQQFVDAAKDKFGNLTLTVLKPFKSMMIVGIRKKGLKVSESDSLTKIATMFKDAVIENKQSFDYSEYNALNPRENFDATEVEGSVGGAAGGEEGGGVSIPPAAVASLVTAVLNYIKTLMDKKASGTPLTADEKQLLNEADKGVNEIEKKQGGASGDWTKALLWLGGAVVVGLIIRAVTKG